MDTIVEKVITAADRFTFYEPRAYQATKHTGEADALPDMQNNPETTTPMYDRSKEAKGRADLNSHGGNFWRTFRRRK